MNHSFAQILVGIAILLGATPTFSQQPLVAQNGLPALEQRVDVAERGVSSETSETECDAYPRDMNTDSGLPAAKSQSTPAAAEPHKLGPLTFSLHWRFRTEAWDWFQPTTGQNAYAFEHSLLRLGIGQKGENFEWLLEGAQDTILDLPTHAVVPGVQGQLGLGGTYYAANSNSQYNVDAFVRQAYVGFKLPASGKLRLGRFTFLDGAEVTPADKTLTTLIHTRITQRLIGDFGLTTTMLKERAISATAARSRCWL